MEVNLTFFAIGALIWIMGRLWTTVVAFKTHVLLGIASLVFWPATEALFLINNPRRSWKPVAIEAIGVLLMIVPASLPALGPTGLPPTPNLTDELFPSSATPVQR